jgi:hypothetical protein
LDDKAVWKRTRIEGRSYRVINSGHTVDIHVTRTRYIPRTTIRGTLKVIRHPSVNENLEHDTILIADGGMLDMSRYFEPTRPVTRLSPRAGDAIKEGGTSIG